MTSCTLLEANYCHCIVQTSWYPTIDIRPGHQTMCRERSIALKEYYRMENHTRWVTTFKHCPKKWENSINLRNGLLFLNLQNQRLSVIHFMLSQRLHNGTFLPQLIESTRNFESRHYYTSKQLAQSKLTEETWLLATKTKPGWRASNS